MALSVMYNERPSVSRKAALCIISISSDTNKHMYSNIRRLTDMAVEMKLTPTLYCSHTMMVWVSIKTAWRLTRFRY